MVGKDTLDDTAVVLPVLPLDEAVALDALDEAGRRGRTEIEDLGDPAHRQRAFEPEQEEEADLAERQVPRRRGGLLAGDAMQEPEEIAGGRGQAILPRWFSHPRIVHAGVK